MFWYTEHVGNLSFDPVTVLISMALEGGYCPHFKPVGGGGACPWCPPTSATYVYPCSLTQYPPNSVAKAQKETLLNVRPCGASRYIMVSANPNFSHHEFLVRKLVN